MKATIGTTVLAESTDVIECRGYLYFPRPTVRLDLLVKAPKTESDRACPHGVQFYDVIVGDARHERAAWSYEAPQPEMQHVGFRFGFWKDVAVG